MNPELQALAVNVIRQRLETPAVHGRRETVRGRNETPILVHREIRVRTIAMRLGILFGPLNIHHDVLPAMALEIRRHVVGVRPDLGFRDGGPERIPTVPAHGRRGSEQALGLGHAGESGEQQGRRQESIHAHSLGLLPIIWVTALSYCGSRLPPILYTTPPFITNCTCSSSPMSVSGSPAVATMSA